jgi:hypothetical protein
VGLDRGYANSFRQRSEDAENGLQLRARLEGILNVAQRLRLVS